MPRTCTSTWPATTSASRRSPGFSDALREVFPGTPELRGGYVHANDGPGWGVDLDETAAARYPITT